MIKNDEDFIIKAFSHLSQNGFSVRMSKRARFNYFDPQEKCIMLQITKSTWWFPYFVHEYCHFLQYLENPDRLDMLLGALPRLEEAIKKNKRADLKDLALVKMLELDCELRAVEQILSNGLSIDVDTYIQDAHCNIFFYDYMVTCSNKSLKTALARVYNKAHLMPVDFLDSEEYVYPKSTKYSSILFNE